MRRESERREGPFINLEVALASGPEERGNTVVARRSPRLPSSTTTFPPFFFFFLLSPPLPPLLFPVSSSSRAQGQHHCERRRRSNKGQGGGTTGSLREAWREGSGGKLSLSGSCCSTARELFVHIFQHLKQSHFYVEAGPE